MSDSVWRRLERHFSKHPILVAEPVDLTEITAAERRLRSRFDPDYVEFVRRFGGAMVGSLPILGLRCAEVMGTNTVVDATEHFRTERWPGTDAWYVVSVDLAGNPIGIDGEGRVWLSDHDAGEIVERANSFADFVSSLLPAS